MDKDRSNLTRILYTFRLYEVTVAVALFVYVVVFIVCSELVQACVT